jgi:hypothetical protein
MMPAPRVVSADTLGCPYCKEFNKKYPTLKKKPTLRQWKIAFERVQLPKHIRAEHPEKFTT